MAKKTYTSSAGSIACNARRAVRRATCDTDYVNRRTGKPKKMFYWKCKKYKEVDGYEGRYYACNDGSVVRFSPSDKGLYAVSVASDGMSIYLSKQGVAEYHRLDVVIATAFCRKEKDCYFVEHRDGNVYNSNPKNLKWVKKNVLYRPAERPQVAFMRMGVVLEQYATPKEAAKVIGMTVGEVINGCNTQRVATNGCYMKWVTPDGYA